MTSSPVLLLAFVVCAVASLTASSTLIVRIERLGTRFGITEAILGLAAALAADAPEIVSATTAMLRGEKTVGTTVILGANVFQLASLLGLGAVLARGIRLDRRVVIFEGIAAVWLALLAPPVVAGRINPWLALGLALIVFVPYVVLSALSPAVRARLPLPHALRGDVTDVIDEEEEQIAEVVGHPTSQRSDGWVAALSLVIVIAASAALETAASTLGHRWGLPDVIVGGVIIAIVTSLPNLVAAVYLARRGRGAATLSEAMNSNRINTLAGLLIPAALLGVAATMHGSTALLAIAYPVMTVFTLGWAYLARGVSRLGGVVFLLIYVSLLSAVIVRA